MPGACGVTLQGMGTTLGAQVVVEVVNPAALADDRASELADLQNAASVVDSPQLPPERPRPLQLRLRHGWEGYPVHGLLLARKPGGELVGSVEIDVAHWDNPELAVLDLQVHPAYRADDTVAEELLRQARGRGTRQRPHQRPRRGLAAELAGRLLGATRAGRSPPAQPSGGSCSPISTAPGSTPSWPRPSRRPRRTTSRCSPGRRQNP